MTFSQYSCLLDSLFKECPHPDDKQRLKLSQELGLKPRQVKFWFQNRRTQMKVLVLAVLKISNSSFHFNGNPNMYEPLMTLLQPHTHASQEKRVPLSLLYYI